MFIVSLLLALLGFVDVASAQSLPKVCATFECTDKMRAIETKLETSKGVDPNLVPAVYSGECYHHSPLYDANHAHHGAIFFERRESSEIFFNGSFAFFYAENPWAHLSVEDARKKTTDPFKFPVQEFKGYGYVDWSMGYPDVLWSHWLSQDPETKNIHMVSLWGLSHASFCELRPNLVRAN